MWFISRLVLQVSFGLESMHIRSTCYFTYFVLTVSVSQLLSVLAKDYMTCGILLRCKPYTVEVVTFACDFLTVQALQGRNQYANM